MLLIIKLDNKKYYHNYKHFSKNDYSDKSLSFFLSSYLKSTFTFRADMVDCYFKVYIHRWIQLGLGLI